MVKLLKNKHAGETEPPTPRGPRTQLPTNEWKRFTMTGQMRPGTPGKPRRGGAVVGGDAWEVRVRSPRDGRVVEALVTFRALGPEKLQRRKELIYPEFCEDDAATHD